MAQNNALVSIEAALKNGWRGHFSSTSSESTSAIVIGIDFGTTYTGVAYAFTDAMSPHEIRINSETRNELETIVEKITVLKQWPNASQQFAEKTPTLLAYENGRAISWGGQVSTAHKTRIAGFKLGLHGGVRHHYTNGEAGLLGGFLADPNWRHPKLPSKTAIDFAADYLALVGNHVMNEVLAQQYDEVYLSNKQVSFALTVPAIWTEGAKDATRKAAERAGIPLDKLTLITEPEAAAHFCATICTEVNLQIGDYFIVCDAGGGTVDLISYKVASLDPFKVVEATVGTGAACGAMYLNDGFERLIRQKLGGRAEEILNARTLAEALRNFETQIKCQFNPMGSACQNFFEVPIPGAPDMQDIELEGGFMTLSRGEIDSIFVPIFEQIYYLVDGQIQSVLNKSDSSNEKIQTIFMVGGFGSNEYLAQYLRNRIQIGIDVKKPAAGWTAINRGAVLHKLGLNFVRERVMRRHYGFDIFYTPFIDGYHPERLKFKGIDGVWGCSEVMEWYARKDQSMSDRHVVEAPFHFSISSERYSRTRLLERIDLLVCDEENAPEYRNSTTISKICSLTVDLKTLPVRAFAPKYGLEGNLYYLVDFKLAMRFGSMLEFEMLWEGEVRGSVATNYF